MTHTPICPNCGTAQIHELSSGQYLQTPTGRKIRARYVCRDCGWFGDAPDLKTDGLLSRPDDVAAAVVVEFNLQLHERLKGLPDMLNGESDNAYHRRLTRIYDVTFFAQQEIDLYTRLANLWRWS